MSDGRRVDGAPSAAAPPAPERTPATGLLRVARGSVVGLTAITLALAGHLAAGGSAPAPITGAALVVLTIAGGVALSGRRWTLAPLVTVLLGAQVVLHIAFAGQPSTTHHHASGAPGAAMFVAHVLAAFGAALLLRRGESWCWQLLALLSRPVHVALLYAARPVSLVAGRRLPIGDPQVAVLRSLLFGETQPRRGPPPLTAG
jgi:hypothetical protein